jgi:hypothetical protein
MTWRQRAASWLREPLVHFMLAGGLVFLLLSGRPADPGERRIVVDESLVTRLADRWTQTFRRPPSPEELDGLIRDYVRDQVYYREALRLGLDRDDEVVVRRMRNKLLTIATADVDAREPDDAELQALLDKDPARYAGEPSFAFEQVYLGADNPANRQAAAALLARLVGGATPEGMGTPAPLPERFLVTPASEIAGQFGDEFAAALGKVPQGKWSGPLDSGLGLHLVRIAQTKAPLPPRLAEIRQRLANDWRAAARAKAEQDQLRELLEGYDVEIEQPAK